METTLGSLLITGLAVGLGALIGLAFGFIQERIHRRLEARNASMSANAPQPGSGNMRRTAYLLIVLAAVQMLCPVFFREGTQWSVTAGLLAGYGMVLYRGFLRKKREAGVVA